MDAKTDNTPQWLLDDIEASEAEIEAGLTVPAEEVHRMLRGEATLEQLEAVMLQRQATRRR